MEESTAVVVGSSGHIGRIAAAAVGGWVVGFKCWKAKSGFIGSWLVASPFHRSFSLSLGQVSLL